MKKIPLFCVILISLLISPVAVLAGNETVLAKAGNMKITVADLNRIIGYYTPEEQEAFQRNPVNKLRLLKKLLDESILADDARKLGIDKEPGVKEQIAILTDNQLASELLKREVADKVHVSDKDARIYYTLHEEDYTIPATVRVRHILVKVEKGADEKTRDAAKEKAESLLKKIKAGEDFGKLAEQFSDDTGSKAKGGDLGFISRRGLDKTFADAALSLKPGEVSGIVKTKFGYDIIKCEEEKPAKLVPFEEVRKDIISRIRKDTVSSKIKGYVEKKEAEAKAEFYPQRLPKPAAVEHR